MEGNIYIFGAGKNGEALLSELQEKKVTFIDNDSKKQNSTICGVECINIDEAIRRGAQNSLVLISANKSKEIEEQLKNLKFYNVITVSKWLRNKKYFEPEVMYETDYKKAVPFNHYESPYPNIVEIHKKEKELFDKDKEVLDIDFNIDGQLSILRKMEAIGPMEWPYESGSDNFRYHSSNDWFAKGCADALYYMIRIVKPKKIIEVGSGYSTAVMLDTNEKLFENTIEITAIEPFPDRLRKLLRPTDNINILESKLEEVPIEFFQMLEENDILFIDSSHVSKTNSDVNYLLFEIFPRLKGGVYIHFHDMFYPFIYPREWVYEGRAYNEMYLLRAFLMNNKEYSVQLFGDMLSHKCGNQIAQKLKGCGNGSLWIKKRRGI